MPSALVQPLHMACIAIGMCCASTRGTAHQAVQPSDLQGHLSILSCCLYRHSGNPGVVRSLSRYLVNPDLSASNRCTLDVAFLPLLGNCSEKNQVTSGYVTRKVTCPPACKMDLDIYKQASLQGRFHNAEEEPNCSRPTVCSVSSRRDSASKQSPVAIKPAREDTCTGGGKERLEHFDPVSGPNNAGSYEQ